MAEPATDQPSFESWTTPRPTGPGRLSWAVPDGWQQGRGAFGGLVLATIVRAMEHGLDQAAAQKIRTLTATLCAPVVAAPATVEVAILRAGNSTTAVEARVLQDEQLRAHAVGLFGTRRVDDGDWNELACPIAQGWPDVEPAALPVPPAPRFTQHLEYRPTGPAPFSGSDAHAAAGWVRYPGPIERRDAAYLVALADSYWPAYLATTVVPRPMATVAFMMEFVGEWDWVDADAPLYYDATSPAAHGGYASETRRLWTPDGRLMAINQQTFCIIK